MNGRTWKGIFHIAGKALSENKSSVLFASGVVGVVTCAVLTAKATPRVDDAMRELPNIPKDRKVEFVAKEVVLPYAPAAASGILAVVAFGMSNKNLARQAAGAAAACAVAEKALDAYQDNVIT